MWLSTEHPVIANSFLLFVLEGILRGAVWGQYLCTRCRLTMQTHVWCCAEVWMCLRTFLLREEAWRRYMEGTGFALDLEELVGCLRWGM